MLKRIFDIVVGLMGLIALAPLLVTVAVWIKRDSVGPIFYRGRRAGLRGRPFQIFKFRTMVVNADKIGGVSTSDRDPRITNCGHLMRKFKLDELPQLINVVWGDMSLVGPRPQVLSYVEQRFTPAERKILDVRPGITDWASIWNADEGAILAKYPDPDLAYDQIIHPTKSLLQLRYVEQHSLSTDIKIIVYTLLRIVWKKWVPLELRDVPPPGARLGEWDSGSTPLAA